MRYWGLAPPEGSRPPPPMYQHASDSMLLDSATDQGCAGDSLSTLVARPPSYGDDRQANYTRWSRAKDLANCTDNISVVIGLDPYGEDNRNPGQEWNTRHERHDEYPFLSTDMEPLYAQNSDVSPKAHAITRGSVVSSVYTVDNYEPNILETANSELWLAGRSSSSPGPASDILELTRSDIQSAQRLVDQPPQQTQTLNSRSGLSVFRARSSSAPVPPGHVHSPVSVTAATSKQSPSSGSGSGYGHGSNPAH
ncbi:hypothetical protein LPJ57_009663 [Coemansia sp. RSA 486]|nr:hypothetical protein LPJ57_009663 [Coemansia sp. RSA 486]